METSQSSRSQRTRDKIRAAAYKLFLQHGYLATSTDAILAEAGVASKETLYRHYASKEDLFVDVLSNLTLSQPHVSAQFAQIPTPHDIPSLRQALTIFARGVLSIMSQPEYLALLRIILSEAPRFPQLGSLFRTTVPQRGFSILNDLLRQAQAQQIIADVDFDAVAHALIGGLLTYALMDMVFAGEDPHPPAFARADALVSVIMGALTRP